MDMNQWRFAAVPAGLVFLFSVPVLRAQSSPPPPAEIPQKTLPPQRAKKAPVPTDIFAGLQYTEDQKAKISKIREDIKARADAVIKDDKLNPDQKGAFLQGFERMERSQIYNVLTPEQKEEVSKRMRERRQEAKKELEKKKAQQPQGQTQPDH
jgi:Spy/CpxP family protein refolding chaperone